jgi:DnaJ-class molecular chaperone
MTQTTTTTCPVCDGRGALTEISIKCATCGGTGKVPK